MICAKCNKKFDTPLELYEGSLKCPKCAQDIIPDFAVTKESDELFRLSENYFFTYLDEVSKAVKKNDYIKSRPKSELDNEKRIVDYRRRAIAYCREAVNMGHPEAIVRMGYYYDNNFIDYGGNNSDRDLIAYTYYHRVLFDDRGDISSSSRKIVNELTEAYENYYKQAKPEGGITAREKVRDIRRQAACYLLYMLLYASDELKQNKKGFNFENKRRALIDTQILTEEDFSETRQSAPVLNRIDSIMSMFYTFGKQRIRTPYLGYFVLSGAELKLLYERLENLDEKQRSHLAINAQCCEIEMQKSEISFVSDEDDYGDITYEWKVVSQNSKVPSVGHSSRVPDEKLEPDSAFFVLFYNGNCSGPYSKGKSADDMKKLYEKRNEDNLLALLRSQNEGYIAPDGKLRIVEHVFYADDYYFAKNFCKDGDGELTHPLAYLIR